MNEETTVPVEESVPESIEPPATEVPETAPETIDWTVETEASEPATVPQAETTASDETEETISEDLSGNIVNDTYTESTEAVVIVDVIESVGSDIVHANLFSGFLICGTLVGIAILRKIHGT